MHADIRSIKQIILFITTLSVPNTNELHIGPESAGSADINNVLELLFLPSFREQLRRRSESQPHLFLITGYEMWNSSFIQSFFLSLARW